MRISGHRRGKCDDCDRQRRPREASSVCICTYTCSIIIYVHRTQTRPIVRVKQTNRLPLHHDEWWRQSQTDRPLSKRYFEFASEFITHVCLACAIIIIIIIIINVEKTMWKQNRTERNKI